MTCNVLMGTLNLTHSLTRCRPVFVRPSASPFVRPSVTLVYCIQSVEEFFDRKRRYPIPKQTPSAGALNTWGGKICDFRLKSPFMWETLRDRPSVAMER